MRTHANDNCRRPANDNFAKSWAGRVRRQEQRQAIARKREWLAS